MIILCKPNRVSRSYLGGVNLDKMQGFENTLPGFYPESWIASTTCAKNFEDPNILEGLSETPDGRFLSDILADNPDYLGKYSQLPILLKLLDSAERLVIQAHPTVEFAKEHFHSPFGKAECWYILAAEEGAHVYLGFKEGENLRERWIQCFHEQNVQTMLSMLHKISVKQGDVLYVDGGVPHAIGGGCLMAELQEPTDLIVVPERKTPSGRVLPELKLHGGLGYEKMFDVFEYNGYSEKALREKYIRHPVVPVNKPAPIIDKSLTDKFRMTEYRVEGTCIVPAVGSPAVAVIVAGSGTVGDSDEIFGVNAGDSLFVPAAAGDLTLSGSFRILIAQP